MSISTHLLAGTGAALFAALVAAHVGADERAGRAGMPLPQKPISHPFVKAVLGSWKTSVSGSVVGTGTATFALGVGDTVLLHDERGDHAVPGGPSMKTAGLGLYKISDDGKTAMAWWIDNHSPEPTKVSGALSDTGFDLSGDTPAGPSLRVVLEKTPKGLVFRMFMGGATEPLYTQAYERAAAVR